MNNTLKAYDNGFTNGIFIGGSGVMMHATGMTDEEVLSAVQHAVYRKTNFVTAHAVAVATAGRIIPRSQASPDVESRVPRNIRYGSPAG